MLKLISFYIIYSNPIPIVRNIFVSFAYVKFQNFPYIFRSRLHVINNFCSFKPLLTFLIKKTGSTNNVHGNFKETTAFSSEQITWMRQYKIVPRKQTPSLSLLGTSVFLLVLFSFACLFTLFPVPHSNIACSLDFLLQLQHSV